VVAGAHAGITNVTSRNEIYISGIQDFDFTSGKLVRKIKNKAKAI
jgi:hypothetical protein